MDNPEPKYSVELSKMSVHDLPETEIGSVMGAKQDPYVKFRLGTTSLQTSYKDGAGRNAEFGGL